MDKTMETEINKIERLETLLYMGAKEYGEPLFASYAQKREVSSEKIDLTDEWVSKMSARLLAYPVDARNLLFGEYCFNLSFDAIEDLFHIRNAWDRVSWYKRLLADECGLLQTQCISDDSWRKISANALEMHIKHLEDQANANEIKAGKTKVRRYAGVAFRYAAAVLLFCTVGLGVTLTVNAEFRERFINWFVQRFNTYSIFFHTTDIETSMEELVHYQPEYIPERYDLVEKIEAPEGLIYRYVEPDISTLYIFINMPDSDIALDTEGMDVLITTFDGEEAFYYSGDHESIFAFSKDGYAMYIRGNVTAEECEQIARNIKK